MSSQYQLTESHMFWVPEVKVTEEFTSSNCVLISVVLWWKYTAASFGSHVSSAHPERAKSVLSAQSRPLLSSVISCKQRKSEFGVNGGDYSPHLYSFTDGMDWWTVEQGEAPGRAITVIYVSCVVGNKARCGVVPQRASAWALTQKLVTEAWLP